MDSFDVVVLIKNMQKENEGDDIFIEKSNNKRVVIHSDEDVHDVCGFVMVIKPKRHIAINPDHIISVINKGDLI